MEAKAETDEDALDNALEASLDAAEAAIVRSIYNSPQAGSDPELEEELAAMNQDNAAYRESLEAPRQEKYVAPSAKAHQLAPDTSPKDVQTRCILQLAARKRINDRGNTAATGSVELPVRVTTTGIVIPLTGNETEEYIAALHRDGAEKRFILTDLFPPNATQSLGEFLLQNPPPAIKDRPIPELLPIQGEEDIEEAVPKCTHCEAAYTLGDECCEKCGTFLSKTTTEAEHLHTCDATMKNLINVVWKYIPILEGEAYARHCRGPLSAESGKTKNLRKLYNKAIEEGYLSTVDKCNRSEKFHQSMIDAGRSMADMHEIDDVAQQANAQARINEIQGGLRKKDRADRWGNQSQMRIAPNAKGECIKRNNRTHPSMKKAMACRPDNTCKPPPPKRQNLAGGDPVPKNRPSVILTPAADVFNIFSDQSRTAHHSDYRQRAPQAEQGAWQHYTAAQWEAYENWGSSSTTRSSGENRSRTPTSWRRPPK